MKSKVSIRTIIPSEDNISKILLEEIGRFDINFQDYRKIVIKPNLCTYRGWETGATTHPLLVEKLIALIRDVNSHAQIAIVESDGPTVNADFVFKMLGYSAIARKFDGVSLINLSKDKTVNVPFNGAYFRGFSKPITLHEADFFITVPKLKTMVADVITGCLKNQYGCNPDTKKHLYHRRLSEVIADLNNLCHPNFCIMDGIVTQDGTGPSHGRPKKSNLLLFGNDPVSTDAAALKLMNLKLVRCRHIELASRLGVGRHEDYELEGDHVEALNFQYVTWRHYFLKIRILLGRA